MEQKVEHELETQVVYSFFWILINILVLGSSYTYGPLMV